MQLVTTVTDQICWRLLLVEGQPDGAASAALGELLRSPFPRNRWILDCTPQVSEALAVLQQERYDVILLALEELSDEGMAAIASLTSFGDRFAPPLLVLTARNDEELVLSCIRAGAQDCLVTGELTDKSLQRCLHRTIERYRKSTREWEAALRDRQSTEANLRESEARLRAILSAIPDLMFRLSADGIYLGYIKTSQFIDMFQGDYDPVGTHVADMIPAELAERHIRNARKVLATGQPITYEQQNWIDGRWQYEEVRIVVSGENEVLFTIRDITDRRHAEEALRQSEARLRAIYERAGVGIAQLSLDGQFLKVNHRYCEILGYTEAELLQLSFQDITHPEDLAADLESTDRLMQGERVAFVMEKRFLRKDGSIVWVNLNVTLIYDTEGKPEHNIGVIEDITSRKEAEAALKASRKRYKALTDASPVCIFHTDALGNCTYVNRRWGEITGIPAELAMGTGWVNPIHPDDRDRVLGEWYEAASSGVPFHLEYRYLRPDGGVVWVIGQAVSQKNEDGSPSGYIGTITDITSRKETEAALRESELREREKAQQLERTISELQGTQAKLVQQEKMASLGQLVAGIAHEINNPVSFIYGNIQPALEYARDLLDAIALYQEIYPSTHPLISRHMAAIDVDFLREDFLKLLNSMQEGAKRIREIVLSLRIFSRLDEAERKVVNLHEGLDSTLMILQHRLKPHGDRPAILVIKDYSDLPAIECYPGQLNQVFMNILGNAIDALEEKMHQQADFVPEIRIRTSVEGDRVLVAIADNGDGIPDQVRQRMFDPFFTTKAVGKGTGLGLSISYQIVVEKHKGTLTCHSEPGQGTEFVIGINLS